MKVKTFSVPTEILHAPGDLSGGELAILALTLIGCKRERDRLYQTEKEQAASNNTDVVPYVDFQVTQAQVESGQFRRLFEFSTDDLTSMLNCSKSNIYNQLHPAGEKIISRFESQGDGRSKFNVLAPIYQATLEDSTLKLRIAEDAVIPFVNYSQGFSIVDLEIWARLRRKGARRLYMLICKHKERHSTLKIALADIRTMLALDESRYQRNADLNKKLIEPAIAEIIEKSVSSVSGVNVWTATDEKGKGFTTARTGRTVSHIEIRLKWNNPKKQQQRHRDLQAKQAEFAHPVNDPTLAIARVAYNKLLAYPYAGELSTQECHIFELVMKGVLTVPDLLIDDTLKQQFGKAAAKVAEN